VLLLRPTLKLRNLLPVSPDDPGASETALGDWYVNRLVLERRPLLLLVSSTSLLAMLTPAREVRTLPGRMPELVAHRLGRLGIPARIMEAELEAMTPVRVVKTVDRSVLGIMVDFAKLTSYRLKPGFSEHADLQEEEEFLWNVPCHAGRPRGGAVWPGEKAAELLEERWG